MFVLFIIVVAVLCFMGFDFAPILTPLMEALGRVLNSIYERFSK